MPDGENDDSSEEMTEENPWEKDEVPWRLEEESEGLPADGTDEGFESGRSGRFGPDEIPDEETEDNETDKKFKMGVVAVAAVLTVLATAYVGATVVADDGSPESDLDAEADANTQTESSEGLGRDTEPNENGILVLPPEAGATGGDQRLRLKNTGDGIRTSQIRIEVTLADHGSSATVTNLPADRLEPDRHVLGDDIFDRSYAGVGGAATEAVWHEDELFLRIKHSDDGAELEPGDEVRVEVARSGSGEVLYSDTLEAE